MSIVKLNNDVKDALRQHRFEIYADTRATIRGKMSLEVMENEQGVLELYTTLPNGMQLNAELSRDYLMRRTSRPTQHADVSTAQTE